MSLPACPICRLKQPQTNQVLWRYLQLLKKKHSVPRPERGLKSAVFPRWPLARNRGNGSSLPLLSAVQSERKPIDVAPRERHTNCAASTQKIYIRKDLNSPLIATPTFVSDTETDGSR